VADYCNPSQAAQAFKATLQEGGIRMRYMIILLLTLMASPFVLATDIDSLPIPLGAGSAVVWQNDIYHFGGSNNWSGSIQYPRVYKYDGTAWTLHDSIPDYNLWDAKALLVGNEVFLVSGWPSGASSLRKYNLQTRVWTYLSSSPNSQSWGVTASYHNGFIYLFDSYGRTYAYNISSDSWETKTSVATTATWDLSSVLYQDEIYIIGYTDSIFYKYTPSSDQWTRLANSPYKVGGCAVGVINDSLYFVGGNQSGTSYAYYRSAIVYDVPSNSWATSSTRLSSKRHWMATVEYKGGLYVLGGIDSLSQSVRVVEEIVPQGTAVGIQAEANLPQNFLLGQNYPNPFNPSTIIPFSLPQGRVVRIELFNMVGQSVQVLLNQYMPAGYHEITLNGLNLAAGIYFYRLETGDFSSVKRLILLK
jgi:N-acetylneuraminic acid mutarotase